jgi:hypothetical protein
LGNTVGDSKPTVGSSAIAHSIPFILHLKQKTAAAGCKQNTAQKIKTNENTQKTISR